MKNDKFMEKVLKGKIIQDHLLEINEIISQIM